MVYMWGGLAFCYYLTGFQLKYLPGDMFNNSLTSSFAEMLGVLIAGVIFTYFGLKLAYILPLVVSLVGCLSIMSYGE
jgi:hypothetical protein